MDGIEDAVIFEKEGNCDDNELNHVDIYADFPTEESYFYELLENSDNILDNE